MKNLCRVCGKEADLDKVGVCEPCVQHFIAKQWEQICPPLYRDTEVARLPEVFHRIIAYRYKSRGMLLHGNTGACKTRMAFMVIRKMLEERRTVSVFLSNTFDHVCARKFGEGEGEAWIEHLVGRDLVFIDDLGKFKLTERNEAELFGLVERRIADLKPMLITTNHVGPTLERKMSPDRGAPFIRRLTEFCDTIPC